MVPQGFHPWLLTIAPLGLTRERADFLLWRGRCAASNHSRADCPGKERGEGKGGPAQARIEPFLMLARGFIQVKGIVVVKADGSEFESRPVKKVGIVRPARHRPGQNRHEHEPGAQSELKPAARGEEAHDRILERAGE